MNQKVSGYDANRVIMTQKCAIALNEVWKELDSKGFNIVIYDAFRPTRAVQNFVRWAEDKNANQTNKASYFPYVDHDKVFDEGYIANRSGHSRGSTIDLSIIELGKSLQNVVRKNRKLSDGREIFFLDDNTLDMGSSFDLFDKASNTLSNLVPDTAHQNRLFLKDLMEKNGFVNYELEWWHFTLKDEPFPDTYFDFQIN
ncbi:D-alanyl-D-alanine dipeptidase [Brachionus plicatilis]|uniref:D-alanyl-D-alanine dipeptidase n=1 Tax=Brachionus plicatilis TaxID=10195 RepID=A0A3M7SY21_BRAPC|nr:D-alanyl-D-alanine dipeptidase [Brachionus plicatilis]